MDISAINYYESDNEISLLVSDIKSKKDLRTFSIILSSLIHSHFYVDIPDVKVLEVLENLFENVEFKKDIFYMFEFLLKHEEDEVRIGFETVGVFKIVEDRKLELIEH